MAALASVAAAAIVAAVAFFAFPSAGDSLLHGLSKLPGSRTLSGSAPAPSLTRNGGGHRTTPGSGGTTTGPTPGRSHHGKPAPTPTGSSHHSSGPSPSGSPTPSTHPSSGSPSPSVSPTPSPTPTLTSPTPTALPPGYAWQSVSAATAGTTAGFRLATPASWLLAAGLDSTIQPLLGSARLAVDMSPFVYQWPVREAKYLQATGLAEHTYHGYHLVAILAIRFHGFAAASWTFSWKPVGALSRFDTTAIVFTAKTSAGPQAYVLSISAPISRTTLASHVMRVAMRTFAPLPG